jgi:hypothetical protein
MSVKDDLAICTPPLRNSCQDLDPSRNCPVEVQNNELCDFCSRVNFDGFLPCSNLASLRKPKTIFRLGHIARSNCPLCQFLRDCCPQDIPEGANIYNKYWLKSGRISPLFGTRRISESTALQIYEQGRYSQPGLSYESRLILPVHGNLGISGRHAGKDDINISLIQEWLNVCDELHVPCKNTAEDSIHSRVPNMQFIDYCSMAVVSATAATREYATLSYVWGNQPRVAADIQTRHLDSLPRVIEDAILLLRRLGIRYLIIG